VALRAVHGHRLAQRLAAQEILRDGNPGPAIPLLFWCLASRPANRPQAEELLLKPDASTGSQPSGSTGRETPRAASEKSGSPVRTRATIRSTGKAGTSATYSVRRSNGGRRTNRESSGTFVEFRGIIQDEVDRGLTMSVGSRLRA
jgi:hypothetical protein